MKKFLFGAMIAFIGFAFSAFCFIYAAIHPWSYNGITGLYGSLLGTNMLAPFIISLLVLAAGLAVCGYEAYRRR